MHFLSSCVSVVPHIWFSITSAPCILCCIKFFHHWYYFCVKLFTMGIISVLSFSPQILSCFILFLIFFLCILFLDILLFINLYCYPPFIMLHYSTIVIWATSGIIRIWHVLICLLLLQLGCIISSCRLLFIRLSIHDDDICCRSDDGGFILWVNMILLVWFWFI